VPFTFDEEQGPIAIHPPAGINASVSSGKSVMICELAAAVHRAAANKGNRTRILVIQRQGELCEQNSDEAWKIGLENSIYSASLNKKSRHYDVIYGTEGTVARALDTTFKEHGFDLILVDEGHQVDFTEPGSQFMRIFAHFYKLRPNMRLLMFSGSWFRGTDSCIGDFWQKQLSISANDENYPEGGVGNGEISTEWMIENGWVVRPQFGWPDHEDEDSYDFSHLQTKSGSWEFDEAELDAATSDIEKLKRICADIVMRTVDRKGVLIFGATHKHLRQIKACLKFCGVEEDQIGVITENTKNKDRREILRRAKAGECKYTLNVGVLTTGINVPWWDTVCFLRPIGSLVLLIQAIGRVLRLLLGDSSPTMLEMDAMSVEERLAIIAASHKPDALVLDYGGVMDRLGEMYENPILEAAQKKHSERKGELIECQKCGEMNSIHARRCIGVSHSGDRCDYFFKSVRCDGCGAENDIVARSCRCCGRILIDPNASLSGKHYTEGEMVPVLIQTITAGAGGRVSVRWKLEDGREPILIFYPGVGRDDAMRKINTRVWFNNFVKLHVKSEQWQFKARNMKAETIEKMAAMFDVPTHMACRQNEQGKWNIGRRRFRVSGVVEPEAEVGE
jgi:superfamily II DNA or RNA helicase